MPEPSPLGLPLDALYADWARQTPQELGYANRPSDQSPQQWQQQLRTRLLDLLAIQGRPDAPPDIRFLDDEPQDGYRRRRGYMVARDGLAVPLLLLEPDPLPDRPMGVCLAVHGHGPGKVIPAGIAETDHARELIDSGQRDYGVQAVRAGYLTLIPDLRGFGELVLREDQASSGRGGCTQLAMRSIQLGRPLMGQRVSDLMQLLDWALARDDVDPARTAITGNSGGGMMSLFTAAVDERIAACVPSCYFSTFAGSILAMFHCPCNFVPGLSPVAEMADLGGLLAPRPMLVVAGTLDPLFPIEDVRQGFAELKAIYEDFDAADRLELYEGPGAHRYYASRVWSFLQDKLA